MDTNTSSSDIVRIAFTRRMAESGEALRLRTASRLSGAEVAAAVGVSPSTLWRWEKRQRVPRGASAVRYADVLLELAHAEGSR